MHVPNHVQPSGCLGFGVLPDNLDPSRMAYKPCYTQYSRLRLQDVPFMPSCWGSRPTWMQPRQRHAHVTKMTKKALHANIATACKNADRSLEDYMLRFNMIKFLVTVTRVKLFGPRRTDRNHYRLQLSLLELFNEQTPIKSIMQPTHLEATLRLNRFCRYVNFRT